MGSSLHVYVGPYIECTEPVTLVRVDHCAAHWRSDDSAYCHVCGRKAVRRYDTVMRAPSEAYWCDEDYEDQLIRVNCGEQLASYGMRCTLAISNCGRIGLHVDGEMRRDVPDAEAGIAEFERAHAADIARLRELGVTVVVKFGVLSYYM